MATVRHLGLLPGGLCYPQKQSFLQGGFVYPPLSLEDATKAVWRVSKWGFSRPNTDFNGNPQAEFSLQQVYASEKHLACAQSIFWQWGAFQPINGVGILLYSIELLPFANFYQDEDFFFPLRMRFQIGGTFGDAFVHNGNLNFTMTNQGYTTDFFPIEYWPYDPGDGLGPIYDSATGEQLRPFPS